MVVVVAVALLGLKELDFDFDLAAVAVEEEEEEAALAASLCCLKRASCSLRDSMVEVGMEVEVEVERIVITSERGIEVSEGVRE